MVLKHEKKVQFHCTFPTVTYFSTLEECGHVIASFAGFLNKPTKAIFNLHSQLVFGTDQTRDFFSIKVCM